MSIWACEYCIDTYLAPCRSSYVIIDVFCRHDIYCMFVRPGRGIPPLLLFHFFSLKGFFCELREVLYCTDYKAFRGKFVILGYASKIDLP